MTDTETHRKIKVFNWILRSYIQMILPPMGFIAIVLLVVFGFTNRWNIQRTEEYLAFNARENLTNLVRHESIAIEKQLLGIEHATRFFQNEVGHALKRDMELKPDDAERLSYSTEDAYVTTRDSEKGGAAVFLSNLTEVTESQLSRIAALLSVEDTMKHLLESNPLQVSLYFNSHDSLNVIYPYFDTASQYPPDMDIPAYNFYYEADSGHNPSRQPVWTDVYLDPAGHGWMASSIAPVYTENFLEGVVGIDVTVDTIAKDILQMDIPWNGYGILLSKDGTIMAMPEQGEKDFGLDEMTTHTYSEAIFKDTFKPEQFNINTREDVRPLAESINREESGYFELIFGGREQIATWSSVGGLEWKLVLFIPKEEVLQISSTLASRMRTIIKIIVLGLIGAYILLFIVLHQAAKQFSHRISKPLRDMNQMLRHIGEGQYDQSWKELQVEELNETGHQIVELGKELEKVLSSNSLLKSANNLKSEFIANMSHEIRTPVNAILGFSMILDKQITDVQQKQHLQTIKKSCNTLLSIINDILDLSKFDAGGQRLRLEAVDLAREIRDIKETYRYEQERKLISIEVSIDDRLPRYLLLDGIRIRQILLNLVGNAVKFTEQGSVTISALTSGEGSTPGSVKLLLIVQDTGVGIENQQQKRIFEPFMQTENQNVRKYGGTGLGLSIVKRFVELMGGSIEVESTVGTGSTFTVTLKEVMSVDMEADFFSFTDGENSSVEERLQHMAVPDISRSILSLEEEELKNNERLSREVEEFCTREGSRAINTNRVRDFHTAADRLLSIAHEHDAGSLLTLARTLKQAAQSFDLTLIRRLLQEIISISNSASHAQPTIDDKGEIYE
ncbi:MAG: hypothetical protein JXK93_13415 [Sphaerochaetaceae bacterium]|nr:hypothetical protein [Sphaerochaetaceae bacterium]